MYEYITLNDGRILFYIEHNPNWFDLRLWRDEKYFELRGKDKTRSTAIYGFGDGVEDYEECYLGAFYENRHASLDDFSIIGLLSDMSDKKVLELSLVEGNNGGMDDTMWKDYMSPRDYYSFAPFQHHLPGRSFLSLLKVNGIDTSKEWVLILKK